MEISSKLHAVEAVEVHYQLHSVALKSLLHCSSPSSSPAAQEGVARGQRQKVESAIAEALVELKEFPLCKGSYPGLWAWTKQLCSKAFSEDGSDSVETQQVGKPPTTTPLEQQKMEGEPPRDPLEARGGTPRDPLEAMGDTPQDPLEARGDTPRAPLEAMGDTPQAPLEAVGDTPQAPLEAHVRKEPQDLLDIAGEHGVGARSEEGMEVDGSRPPQPRPPSGGGDRSCDSVQLRGGVVSQPPPQTSSYLSLLQLCIYGVAVCAVRYPAFFKPLYRLAATLHTIGLPSVSASQWACPLSS